MDYIITTTTGVNPEPRLVNIIAQNAKSLIMRPNELVADITSDAKLHNMLHQLPGTHVVGRTTIHLDLEKKG